MNIIIVHIRCVAVSLITVVCDHADSRLMRLASGKHFFVARILTLDDVIHFQNAIILPNVSTSRLAPPTRAPLMSGWAISLPIFSGLTLPP